MKVALYGWAAEGWQMVLAPEDSVVTGIQIIFVAIIIMMMIGLPDFGPDLEFLGKSVWF